MEPLGGLGGRSKISSWCHFEVWLQGIPALPAQLLKQRGNFKGGLAVDPAGGGCEYHQWALEKKKKRRNLHLSLARVGCPARHLLCFIMTVSV